MASVAKGYSENVDTLFGQEMSESFQHYFPIGMLSFLSPYFDWFAFGITLILTGMSKNIPCDRCGIYKNKLFARNGKVLPTTAS